MLIFRLAFSDHSHSQVSRYQCFVTSLWLLVQMHKVPISIWWEDCQWVTDTRGTFATSVWGLTKRWPLHHVSNRANVTTCEPFVNKLYFERKLDMFYCKIWPRTHLCAKLTLLVVHHCEKYWPKLPDLMSWEWEHTATSALCWWKTSVIAGESHPCENKHLGLKYWGNTAPAAAEYE